MRCRYPRMLPGNGKGMLAKWSQQEQRRVSAGCDKPFVVRSVDAVDAANSGFSGKCSSRLGEVDEFTESTHPDNLARELRS